MGSNAAIRVADWAQSKQIESELDPALASPASRARPALARISFARENMRWRPAMQKPILGRWESCFGRALGFHDEADAAQEINAVSEDFLGQTTVRLSEPLPGFSTPLWAADENWLYLRQPEGAWKVKIPKLRSPEAVLICQSGKIGAPGNMVLDPAWLNLPSGWRRGDDGPLTARMIDEEASRPAGCPPIATEVCPLGPVVEWTPEKMLVSGGEAFGDARVTFSTDADWLLVSDLASDRVVAYQLRSEGAVRRAFDDGALWMRFEGDWLGTVDVPVRT